MSIHNQIPFLDLVAPHAELEQELTEIFRRALLTAGFIGGPMVEAFEDAFANFCDTPYSIAVNSGTDALRFALMACGIRSGDAVITVPHTFIATTEAISQAGAVPEFVDIDARTYTMSVELLRLFLEEECTRDSHGKLISRRSQRPVTAIVPVHLYGQMADMDGILECAEQYGLVVVEDACQAHGASYFSKRRNLWMTAGTIGRAAAFSFYPGKNLGACGEAGAVTTNDPNVSKIVKMLRDHGQVTKYYHDVEGYNGRLDAMQAGFLHVKLSRLEQWNEQRRERANTYNRLLAGSEAVLLPYEPSWSRSVYHLYVIRTSDRDGMIRHLASKNIGTGIHYPVPLHMQRAYQSLGFTAEDFPVSARVAKEIVSLPMYPHLATHQQIRVAEEVLAFASGTGPKRAATPSFAEIAAEQTA
jgi:dTDP-4-amino-4,6-dideoxygalactose transaminase